MYKLAERQARQPVSQSQSVVCFGNFVGKRALTDMPCLVFWSEKHFSYVTRSTPELVGILHTSTRTLINPLKALALLSTVEFRQ